jgi:hypothetical protein
MPVSGKWPGIDNNGRAMMREMLDEMLDSCEPFFDLPCGV